MHKMSRRFTMKSNNTVKMCLALSGIKYQDKNGALWNYLNRLSEKRKQRLNVNSFQNEFVTFITEIILLLFSRHGITKCKKFEPSAAIEVILWNVIKFREFSHISKFLRSFSIKLEQLKNYFCQNISQVISDLMIWTTLISTFISSR